MVCCTKIQFKIKMNTRPNFDFKIIKWTHTGRQGGNALLKENSKTDSGTSRRHSLNQVSVNDAHPPSLRKQDVSCHALTQSEKNLPSPDVTLSQDALSADISSGGPRAPPTHRKTESISFVSGSRILPAGGHRELLLAGTAQP